MMHVIGTGSLRLEPQIAAHAEEMFAVLSDPVDRNGRACSSAWVSRQPRLSSTRSIKLNLASC